MTTRIKLRRDTTANWTDVNPILANGEMGIEADTRRTKIGDGTTRWNDLKYAGAGKLIVDDTVITSETGVGIANEDPKSWISTVNARFNWAGTDGVAYDSMGNLYLSGWEEYGYDLEVGGPAGNGSSFLIKFDPQGQVEWTRYIGTELYNNGGGVVVDSDDNIIQLASNWEETQIIVTKFASDGDHIWQKRYNDTNDFAQAYALAVDSNNDLVFAGRRNDPDHSGSYGIFVTKILGSTGAVSWSKTMGRDFTNVWQPSLAIDGNNNVIFAGMDSQNSQGQSTIAKLTSSGSPVWTKTIRNPESQWDGYELDIGSLDADADGNIYFVGSYVVPDFVTDIQNNTENGRAGLILKMNSSGVVQWSRIVGPGDCEDMGAQVIYKDGKLYATFQTERKYYKNDFTRNEVIGYTTQEIVLACYDVNNGKVLWQRNFGPEVLWGYASPTGNPGNNQDTQNYSGKLIAVYGNYVAVAGQAGLYDRSTDNDIRSYGFLTQLPADGTEMDLAGWSYRKSKHKGLYAQVASENYSDWDINVTTDIVLAASNEFTPTDSADNVVIKLISADANQWDFKPNGDLALPVGGNIEISRAAQGSINVVGYFDSDNTNGLGNYFNSVTTDADGNQYYVGKWNWHDNWTPNGSSVMPMVVKVNTQGQVEWKVRLSNTHLFTNAAVYGEATTVAYDPASGNIVVVATDSGEGNSDQMLIVDLDTTTGKVVETHRFSAADDIRANGIAINTSGDRFITGSIEGSNYINFTVTNAMISSTATVDTIMVPRSVFDGYAAPSWVGGGTTGWALYDGPNLNEVDYYDNISGTVREGSGARFDVTIGSDGSITNPVAVANGGSNYLVGHKIKLPYTAVAGTGTDTDIILSVTGITTSTGAITSVAAGYYGAGQGSTGTYTALAGTNYNIGSGFTISVQVNNSTATNNLIVYHYAGGTHYVVGDVITFAGTQFGGTNPETNIVITALQVGEFAGDVQSGEDTGYAVTTRGVSPLTYVRLQFNGADFSGSSETTYQLQHYTDANSFLAKFVSIATTSTSLVWAKWIEKSNYDRGIAVDYDSEGNLYWASVISDEYELGGDSNYQDRPVITKISSTGTALWSRSYSIDGNEGTLTGLQVDSEDRVVMSHLSYDNNSYQNNPVVVRLDKNGDKLWTKRFFLDGGEGNGGGLALDSDDNIYITSDNYDGEDYVSWSAKLDCQDGNEIWQQEVANSGQDTYHGWNGYSNAIATDGNKYYIGKYTLDLDGNEGNALALALPADGSAENTEHGPFVIAGSTYETDGGEGNNGYDAPLTRNYLVSTATNKFTEITADYAHGGRDPIQSWIEPGPTSNYAVYTNSNAGIVFGDGTVQTTSASGLPQIRHKRYNKRITLKASDAGKHLYIKNSETVITVPTYSEVEFPVGTMITIVNLSGGYVYVAADKDNYRTNLYCPQLDGNEGSSNYINGFRFQDNGGGNLITLLKVEESYSNGSRWIVNGNNASLFTDY